MKSAYTALYDDISRELYFLRLALDLEFNPDIICRMVTLSGAEKRFRHFGYDIEVLSKAIHDRTPIMIYGAGINGKQWYSFLKKKHAEVIGFYDKNYKNISSVMGIPVFEPPKKVQEDYIILIATISFVDEIENMLIEKGFSAERILRGCNLLENDAEHQYFDFRDKYPEGGAFVDAGCFNCDTSVRFSRWCDGKYSKIFAFEPDAINMKKCKKMAQENRLQRIDFYQFGLAKEVGVAHFVTSGTVKSAICNHEEGEKIPLTTIDSIVKETKTSFIKMDIEGAELSALQGAINTIQRDKPLCAISVYHKPGDMVVIMDYLMELVPEYKFALRHYSNMNDETVLYAFLE